MDGADRQQQVADFFDAKTPAAGAPPAAAAPGAIPTPAITPRAQMVDQFFSAPAAAPKAAAPAIAVAPASAPSSLALPDLSTFGQGSGIGPAIERGVSGLASFEKGLVGMPALGAAKLGDYVMNAIGALPGVGGGSLGFAPPVPAPTPLEDAAYKYLLAPENVVEQQMQNFGKNATTPEKVATNIASFGAQLPALIAGGDAGEGGSLLARAVPWLEGRAETASQYLLRMAQEHTTGALGSILAMGAPAAVNAGAEAYPQTGALGAANAAAQALGQTGAQMMIPLSAPGGIVTRAVTGGLLQPAVTHALNPNAGLASLLSSGIIGATTGAGFGPAPEEPVVGPVREAPGAAVATPDAPYVVPRTPLSPEDTAARRVLIAEHNNAPTPDTQAAAAQAIAAFDIAHAPAPAIAPLAPEAMVTPRAAAPAQPAVVPEPTAAPPAAIAVRPEPTAQVAALHTAMDAQQNRLEALQGAHANPAQTPAPAADLGELQQHYLQTLGNEIGWDERGGKIIRAPAGWEAPGAPNEGDVVGRTSWTAKPGPFNELSGFWSNRPDARLTEAQARDALTAASTGGKLSAPQQRFVDYANSTAQDYAVRFKNEQEAQDSHLADMSDQQRATELDGLREFGAHVPPQDADEALTLSQWADRAYHAGVDPTQAWNAMDGGTEAEAFARLHDLIQQQGAGNATVTDATQGDRAGTVLDAQGRNGEPTGLPGDTSLQASGRVVAGESAGAGRSGVQEPAGGAGNATLQGAGRVQEDSVTPQSGLFAPGTSSERLSAEARAKDAQRNGLNSTGRTDMGAGPGDLFSGPRPQQMDLGGPSASFTEPKPILRGQAPAAGSTGALDLFFPEQRGDAGDSASRNTRKQTLTAVNKPDEAWAKDLNQRVKLVRTGEFHSGVERVTSAADAAHILAPLRKSAQEQILILVTDADGKPLAVLRHSMGTTNASSLQVPMLAGAVASVPGAHDVYFAHNHPSGTLAPSVADVQGDASIRRILSNSGITMRDSIIVANGQNKFAVFNSKTDAGYNAPVAITTAARNAVDVPRVERQISKSPIRSDQDTSDTPHTVEIRVQHAIKSGQSSGMLMLDNFHHAIGIYPMSVDAMAKLRTDDTGTSVLAPLRALHTANAGSVVLFGPADGADAMQNLGKALEQSGVKTLDIFTHAADGTLSSRVKKAQDVLTGAPGAYLSPKQGEESGTQAPTEAPRPMVPAAQTQHSRDLATKINKMLEAAGKTGGVRLREVARDDLPEAERVAMDAFDRATGTRAVVIRNLTPEVFDFNGVNLRDGRLFVDEKSDVPMVTVLGHEFTHQLRKDQPALYDQLEAEVNKGNVPAYSKERLRTIQPAKIASEELTADAVGDAMSNHAFLRKLAAANPSVFRQVADTFSRYLDTMLAKMGKLADLPNLRSNRYLWDVEQFRTKLLDVMRDYRPGRASPEAGVPIEGEDAAVDDAGNPDIRFQGAKPDEHDLIAQHNTTSEKLLHADRMGGLAAPSLGITRVGHPLDSFGAVTLLGDKSMATPSSRMRVFGSDVYSERYPSVQHRLTSSVFDAINRTLAPFRKDGDEPFSGASNGQEAEDLTSYPPFKRWADAQGNDAGTYSSLRASAEQLLRSSGAPERIFRGYDKNGNRRYIPHTLDNVVRIMSKGIRAGEDFNYGLGNLRARATPEFRSLDALRGAKSRLMDPQAFDAVRKEVNNELFNLAEAIGGPRVPDTALSILEDAPRMGIGAAAKQYDVTLTPEVRQQALDFMAKLKTLPTAYFEGKAPRAVGIHEFKAAVIPSDLSDAARGVLQKHGLPTFEYDRNTPGAREEAIRTAAGSAPDLMFSKKEVPDDGMAPPTDLAGDTRESVAKVAAAEARRMAESNRAGVLSSLAAHGYELGSQGWNADTGKWEGVAGSVNNARINLQDKMLSMREAQKDIEKQLGSSIPDAMNVYMGENLMHGAAGDAMRGLQHDTMQPLVRRMRNLGISSAQLQDFLLARHAPERNARIAEINPAMPDGGIGITTKQAQAVLAGEAPGPYSGKIMDAATRAKIEQIAPLLDKLRAFALDTLEKSGQITAQQASTLRGMYQHYVPARGQKADDDAAFMGQQQGPGSGRGLSAMRVGIKRALGRGEGNLPQNIIGEMIGDAQRSIVGAAKAGTGRQMLRLALAHPNPDFWQVEPVDMEWKFSQQTGEAYLAPKSAAEDAHRSMLVNEGGHFYRIRFHNPQVAEAMLNLGPRDFNSMARVLSPMMRYLSATMTTYNPGFLPVNMTRDLFLGMTKVVADYGPKMGAQVLAKWPGAIRAMWGDYAHRAGDADVAQETQALRDRAREFAKAGGMTDIAVVPDVATLGKQMDHAIMTWREALGSGHPLVAAGKVVMPLAHAVERANVAIENGIRLAAFSALREQDVSVAKAASYAKDMTINFNRKGRLGAVLNSLYLFYNASVQGAHTVGKLVKDHPGVGMMLAGLSGLQATMALSMMNDKGKDGISTWDTIPEYRKMTSLIIPAPWSKDGYAAIPLAYGFNWFAYAGGRMAQHFSGNDAPGSNVIGDLTGAGVRSFSPFPLDQGVGGALPFLFAKVVQLAANKTDYGSSIARDGEGAKFAVPKAAQGRVDTPELYKKMAWGLNRLGGGDDYTPPQYMSSLTDVAPEDLEWMVQTALGGIGSTVDRTERLAEGVGAGTYKDVPSALSATPIANSFGYEGSRSTAIGTLSRATEDEYQRGLARLRGAYASGGAQAFADERAKLGPMFTDIAPKALQSGPKAGQPRLNAGGLPTLTAPQGTFFQADRLAGKQLRSIGQAIVQLRSDSPISTGAVLQFYAGPGTPQSAAAALHLPSATSLSAPATGTLRRQVLQAMMDRRAQVQDAQLVKARGH